MSQIPDDTPTQDPALPQPKRRSRGSKLLEFVLWIALSFLVAWVLVQNVDSILPANNF
jgi:hypothetical protein